ncbi:MAG TPA: zf-HC2 domain-containing protein [Holophagaceae bacterium]|nr:zf-HC2 domain-containing protein [Holophagaceae bacterium]
MSRVMSCQWTTDLMTDYLEGALSPVQRAGMGLHLGMCPRCRAFLASLRRLPALVREALAEAPEATGKATSALSLALGRIQAGEAKQPLLHPDPETLRAAAEGRLPLPLRMLMEVHAGRCSGCRAAHPGLSPLPASASREGAPPLPEGLRGRVLPEARWRWTRHGLGRAKAAEIFKDPTSGAGLWLTYLPAGARFPRHRHASLEASVVLDGWVNDGPHLVGPGDFLQHEGGSEHAPFTEGTDGCWILAHIGPEGVRFRGWRRLFGLG